jgi:hypothetical protein
MRLSSELLGTIHLGHIRWTSFYSYPSLYFAAVIIMGRVRREDRERKKRQRATKVDVKMWLSLDNYLWLSFR